MLVTTWNDTNILRHSLDLSRYCPHRDAAAPMQLALPGGELAIRRICSDPIRVIFFKASFHQPRFLCLEYLPQHVPMLVLSISEDGKSAARMELLHAPAQQASLYWRAKQHSLFLLPMPGSVPLRDSAPLPICPQSIALLQEWSGIEDNTPDILRKEQALWYSLRDELQLGPLFRPVPGNLLEGIRETGRYLFQHPASNDTIASLAKRAGMSATYLKTYFQQYYGLPIHRFRQYYRMQQACRLLHHTANGLSDIALQCGFRDDSNFIRAFQRYYGISPTRAFR